MWEGPENPREYMNAVMENTICVDKWNELAIKNDLLESNQIIDLRKFFNPLTFLNALRQLTCRSGMIFISSFFYNFFSTLLSQRSN